MPVYVAMRVFLKRILYHISSYTTIFSSIKQYSRKNAIKCINYIKLIRHRQYYYFYCRRFVTVKSPSLFLKSIGGEYKQYLFLKNVFFFTYYNNKNKNVVYDTSFYTLQQVLKRCTFYFRYILK